METDPAELQPFFSPRSLVVYGASEDAEKTGGRIYFLLQRYGRPVFAIHPSADRIGESPVYRSARSLPEAPDLAVLAVSARRCEEALADALEAGVKAVVAVASGFGETGPEGLEAERRLVRLARSRGARLLGPNTLGLFLPHKRLDTLFVEHGDRSLLPGGSIAVVSQSGSVGVEALGYASASGFGLRAFVGLGNKSDLNEMDMAAWFGRDEGCRVLGFYLEDLVDGRPFLEELSRIAARKPIVLLKGGRTAEGARAVVSHTGGLAGSGSVAHGAWRQFGVLSARDDLHFCDICKVLSLCPPMAGDRVAILSPAGGYGVMAVDALASLKGPVGLRVAELGPETISRLREVLLPFASPQNPVDLTAACTDATYDRVLDILMRAPEVDALLVVGFFAPEGISSRLVNIIATRNRQSRKPMVVFSMYGPFTDQYLLGFYDRGVAAFGSLSRAVDALVALRERRMFLDRLGARPGAPR
ncbi:MAG: CoA-binding protein [bacterium]